MISPEPSAVFHRLEDGGVILNVESGAYFQVNNSGRVIWETLEGGAERDDLIEAVIANFEIDREQAVADTDTFLRQLDERSLIDI